MNISGKKTKKKVVVTTVVLSMVLPLIGSSITDRQALAITNTNTSSEVNVPKSPQLYSLFVRNQRSNKPLVPRKENGKLRYYMNGIPYTGYATTGETLPPSIALAYYNIHYLESGLPTPLRTGAHLPHLVAAFDDFTGEAIDPRTLQFEFDENGLLSKIRTADNTPCNNGTRIRIRWIKHEQSNTRQVTYFEIMTGQRQREERGRPHSIVPATFEESTVNNE